MSEPGSENGKRRGLPVTPADITVRFKDRSGRRHMRAALGSLCCRLTAVAGAAAMVLACATMQTDWRTADSVKTPGAYRVFLALYPNGALADSARMAIEQIAWRVADSARTEQSINGYLGCYPNGIHAAEAGKRLEELAWQRATGLNSEPAYRVFLRDYSGSAHASEALGAIDRLAKEQLIADSLRANPLVAIPGTFVNDAGKAYEPTYWLVPAATYAQRFPLLREAGPSRFFGFAPSDEDQLRALSAKNIGVYGWVRGFSGFYDRLKDSSIYAIQANKQAITESLAIAHRAYAWEYERYLSTIFLFDCDEVEVCEDNYDLDRQILSVHTKFAEVDVPEVSCGYGGAQAAILRTFLGQGYRVGFEQGLSAPAKLAVDLPLEAARVFFSDCGGTPGHRKGRGVFKYWVEPVPRYIDSGSGRVTGMSLIRAELILKGRQESRLVTFLSDE